MSSAEQNDDSTHHHYAGSLRQRCSTGGECIFALERTGQIGGDFIQNLIEAIQQYLEQHPPDYGDAESLVDLLFWQYVQTASSGNEKIRDLFTQLRELCQLPQNQFDEVFDVVSDLCLEHSRLAFAEGVKTAVRFLCEAILPFEKK